MTPPTPTRNQPPPDRRAPPDWIEVAIQWASGTAAVGMFAYGVALSYAVLHAVAAAADLPGWAARLWPLGFEAFMASAALNALAEQRHRRHLGGWQRVPWYPWTLTGLTAGGSILLNWFHPAIPLDPPPGWLVSLVYGLPPLIAVFAWHLFLQGVAHRRHPTLAGTVPAAVGQPTGPQQDQDRNREAGAGGVRLASPPPVPAARSIPSTTGVPAYPPPRRRPVGAALGPRRRRPEGSAAGRPGCWRRRGRRRPSTGTRTAGRSAATLFAMPCESATGPPGRCCASCAPTQPARATSPRTRTGRPAPPTSATTWAPSGTASRVVGRRRPWWPATAPAGLPPAWLGWSPPSPSRPRTGRRGPAMHEHGCPHQHHRAGTGGGGVLVLVAVLALLILAAPQAHTLRPLVDQLRQAGPLPFVAAPTPLGTGRDGRVCPVRGPVRIGQGWGAPRDGGRRRHQGIDLLAPAGTPLVAVADGRITRLSNRDRGLGGISLRLTDRAGAGYYYAHNQRNLVHLGQQVRAGQVIAQVGATGNARGGPPHLHFQIHPGGGPPVNPDAIVRRWC